MPNEAERIDLLATVHYEATRAALDPELVLAVIHHESGFHKYAVKWEPGKQTFYFDGQPFYSVNVSMGDRMYILLSFQFGSASGQADASTPTGPGNAFEIRYVRAWNFKK